MRFPVSPPVTLRKFACITASNNAVSLIAHVAHSLVVQTIMHKPFSITVPDLDRWFGVRLFFVSRTALGAANSLAKNYALCTMH